MLDNNNKLKVVSALLVLLFVFICTRGRSEGFLDVFSKCRKSKENVFVHFDGKSMPYVLFTSDGNGKTPKWRTKGCPKGDKRKNIKTVLTAARVRGFTAPNLDKIDPNKFGTKGQIGNVQFPMRDSELSDEQNIIKFKEAILKIVKDIPEVIVSGKYKYVNVNFIADQGTGKGTIYYRAFTPAEIKEFGLVASNARRTEGGEILSGIPTDIPNNMQVMGTGLLFRSNLNNNLPTRKQMGILKKANALLDNNTVGFMDIFGRHVAAMKAKEDEEKLALGLDGLGKEPKDLLYSSGRVSEIAANAVRLFGADTGNMQHKEAALAALAALATDNANN